MGITGGRAFLAEETPSAKAPRLDSVRVVRRPAGLGSRRAVLGVFKSLLPEEGKWGLSRLRPCWPTSLASLANLPLLPGPGP